MEQKLELISEWNTVLIKYYIFFVSANKKVLLNTIKKYVTYIRGLNFILRYQTQKFRQSVCLMDFLIEAQ